MSELTEFERFTYKCREVADELGLQDWHIEIRHEGMPDSDEECRARTWMNWPQRAARIVWNDNNRQRSDSVCDQTPEEYAIHEVLHIAIHPLIQVAIQRGNILAVEVEAEEHALIRRFMNYEIDE